MKSLNLLKGGQMKTQFMEQSDINCLSEFDPPPLLNRQHSIKVVGGLMRANNLRRISCSVSYALIKGGFKWQNS